MCSVRVIRSFQILTSNHVAGINISRRIPLKTSTPRCQPLAPVALPFHSFAKQNACRLRCSRHPSRSRSRYVDHTRNFRAA